MLLITLIIPEHSSLINLGKKNFDIIGVHPMPLPTNTSTWTKTQYQTAVAADISPLTTTQIAGLGHADWLSAAGISGLSSAQVEAITTNWSNMGAAWLNALQVTAIAGIPTSGIPALTTAAIAGLDVAHVKVLTANQIGVLSTTQIGALSAAQIAVLSAAQVAALTTTQIAKLSAAQMAGLSATAAAGLTAAQISALGAGISKLSDAAMAGIAPTTLAKIAGWNLSELTTTQIAALTTGQLAMLAGNQTAYLSEGQLQALGTKLQALSASALAALATPNLLAIYTYLSATQIAALPTVLATAVKTAVSQSATLLSALTSGGLLNPVKAALTAGYSLYSYQGIISVLKAVSSAIGSSGLTNTQLTDLRTLTKAVGTVDGTSSYLYGVLNAVVNGNAANATWTGGTTSHTTLGNLAVGSTAAQFTELVGKWFLGTDLPSWTSTTTWTAKTAPLFATTGIASTEASQGGISDCYLISAMVETARDQPGLIASMFTDNGNGSYGVRLYAPSGTPLYFTVDSELPTSGYVASNASGAFWVSLLEKAFVAWKNEVYGSANAYASISGGWDAGLTAITGKSDASYFCGSNTLTTWDTKVKSAVIAALGAGQEVLFGSFISDTDKANGKTDMVASHEFAVIGYDTATSCFIMRNPWGAAGGSSWNGTFEQSIDQLWGGTSGSSASSGFIVANGSSSSVANTSPLASAANQLASAISSFTSTASGVAQLFSASQQASYSGATLVAAH